MRYERKNGTQPRKPHDPAHRAAWLEAYKKTERAREVRRGINERRKAYLKAWREAHQDELRAAKRLYKAWREAHISKRAMPAWADKERIAAIYAEARQRTAESGVLHVVDHVLPLKGDAVWGLHCEANLRVTTSAENLRKNKRVDAALIG